MIKTIGLFLKISLIASFILGILGMIVALFFQAPVLKGAYIAIMIGAVIPMLGAVFHFAAPSIRTQYMTQEIKGPSKGAESLPFAIAGIFMMSIAFLIEAMLH